MSDLLKTLLSRKLVHDHSDPAELGSLLSKDSTGFYCGIDPTADSMHVGHLAAVMMMRRLQRAGHRPIVLLGSATGMIGDPSGKSEERKLLTQEEIIHNAAGIESQAKRFLSKDGKNGYKIVSNNDWLSKFSFIDFLRDVGKHFSVNMMLAKDSVKARLENREQGISYTEFSYMLLQAYDFLHLYQAEGCRLQIGGSDQWGNITAGIELIRRKSPPGSSAAHGLTIPLVTTKGGTKFGKTEAGAVWLDPRRTSPYRFYQFWLNTSDEDVAQYIRMFLDLPDDELASLDQATAQRPDERSAQRRLATELTTLLHGETETKKALAASQVLFGDWSTDIDPQTLKEIFSDVPSTTVKGAEFSAGVPIHDLLVRTNLAKSKGDARRLIEGGGVYLNNDRVTDQALTVSTTHLIGESLLVIRSGKKNYHLVQRG